MSNLNQRAGLTMTQDERLLLDMYINQYNQANNQITRLYNTMDSIRNNINNIIGISRANMNNISNTNINGSQRNNRNTFRTNMSRNTIPNINNLFNTNPYVFYDYNNPISPATYINNETETEIDDNLTNLLSVFLSSTVPVRPTAAQIASATSLIRYSEIQNPISNSCPISLDNFLPNDEVRQINYCGHIFSKSSFDEWFCNNVRCPVCRYDIRTYRPNISLPIPAPIGPTINRESISAVENNEHLQGDVVTNRETVLDSESETESETETETNVNYNENSVNNRRTINHGLNINNRRNRDRNNSRNIRSSSNSSESNSSQSALNMLTTSIFESLLSYPARRYNREPETNDERLFYDPSLNTITYETIIRPNRNSDTQR